MCFLNFVKNLYALRYKILAKERGIQMKKEISNKKAVIALIVIALLLITLGMVYANFFANKKENNNILEEKVIQNENKNNEIVAKKNDSEVAENENTNKENDKNYNADAVEKISKEGTKFIIDQIDSKGNKYEITAYILEENRKTFTQEEYNQILNGKEFSFRNKVWKYEPLKTIEGEEFAQVKSGNSLLALTYDKEDKVYTLENVAGAKIGGLADTLKESVKFEVDSNLYVGDMFTTFENDNGKIKILDWNGEEAKGFTIEDLIIWNSKNELSGTYEECKAVVVNGKVAAIQCFND